LKTNTVLYTYGRPVNGVYNCFPGNDNLHAMTAHKKYSLRIDLTTAKGETSYADYTDFAVASEGKKYKLTLGTFHGTAGKYNAYFVYHRSYMYP